MRLSLLQFVVTIIGCVGYLTDVGVGTSLSPSPSSPLLTDEASGYASPFVLQPLPTRSLDASAFFSTVEITSRLLLVSPTPTPAGPIPVFEDPVPTFGNNKCEKYVAQGHCETVLSVFPGIVSNHSRKGNQFGAMAIADQFVDALVGFDASEICLELAVPMVCRWTIPTCDPAFRVPTYQPLCRHDCEVIRDFVCKRPWLGMLELLHLLNIPDEPDCSPLVNTEAGNAPMCVGTIQTGAVPLPQITGTDCYSGTGRGYTGTINETHSGIPCQSWNASYPHQHLLNLEGFEELDGGHNYCRNPGNRGVGPWCFTTDREVRWEYCNVPKCEEGSVCEPHSINATYNICRTTATIGMDLIFINKSRGNQKEYDEKMNDIQRAVMDYSDHCRDILLEYLCVTNFPQCDLSHTSPKPHLPCKSFCELVLSRCEEDLSAFIALRGLVDYYPLRIEFDCNTLPESNGGDAPECFLPITLPPEPGSRNCYNTSNNGIDYIGTINVTVSERTCQKWTSQGPHPHSMTPVLRPYLDKHNYCRNPEGRGERPWCYTTDPEVRWEYCSVPACTKTTTPERSPLLQIPTWAIATVVIAAGCSVLLIILVLIFCLYCVNRMLVKKQRRVHRDSSDPRYTEGPVRFMAKNDLFNKDEKVHLDSSGGNPLYARSAELQQQQQQLEYDGVKLPEYPRSKIIYIRDLGQGHFGVVVQAEAAGIEEGKETSTVAIKVLKEGASPQIKKEFFREASLMCAFDHPNILKLLGVCIEMEPLCMIFEYMELGDLNNFLQKNSPNSWGSSSSLNHSVHLKPGQASLTTQQLVVIAVDIATGLEYLAQNHYVHRDLATRNCLVSGELRVKISDFGLSQDIYSTDYFRLGDSELLPIRWMPPEAILYAKFTTQSDVWSFGIVIWEIFSFGMQPYFSLTNEEVVAHVRDGNVLNCPDKCPQEIYDLMLDCWAMNPNERPTAAELNMGLRRWSPDLSATLQMQAQAKPVQPDYQNMAVVREYATTQLSAHSTSGRALNDSGFNMGAGEVMPQTEMAPPPTALEQDCGDDGGQTMAPLVPTSPTHKNTRVPTVAYSSCSGEVSAHTNEDHQETTLV